MKVNKNNKINKRSWENTELLDLGETFEKSSKKLGEGNECLFEALGKQERYSKTKKNKKMILLEY